MGRIYSGPSQLLTLRVFLQFAGPLWRTVVLAVLLPWDVWFGKPPRNRTDRGVLQFRAS
jgi:hypothetical protein